MANLNGFIKLHRKLLKWEWYSDINVRVLFFHCLLRANHQPERWQGIEIKRGEFVTSYQHLALESGLTVRQVRTALDKLKLTGEVSHKGQSQYSIISIKNWDKWQANDKQVDKQATSERQTDDKRATTNKNIEEIKEYKENKEIKKDIICNLDFEKSFKIYATYCKNLIPLHYERRNRQTLEELNEFLNEVNYDFDYFTSLCQKANSLVKIVDNKIDFRSMVRNHIGIMNGKYEAKKQASRGVSSETIQRAIAEARARQEAQSG